MIRNFFRRTCFFSLLLAQSLGLSSETPHAVFTGRDSGFFSCFQVVIGILDSYENGVYSGFTVDFGTTGLYYDKTRGPNWWTYYFKPLHVGSESAQKYILDTTNTGGFAMRAFSAIPRERCKYLINKYIKLKPGIKKTIRKFISRKLHHHSYVSVQYRGTDKFASESTYVSPEQACNEVAKILRKKHLTKKRIFVATDVESFFQLMKNKFKKRVVSFKTTRSTDGSPVHLRTDISGYQKGLEALSDCLLLSKSSFLIRTASNLSNTALLFNPKLPSICLNESFIGTDR